MNITVYLGATEGSSPAIKAAAAELGEWIGKKGNTLVYGGSKTGLMGILAGNVLQNGGKVIGVEPKRFIELDYQYEGLTELIVTEDMSERKKKMIELGDAFIAFPGGTGTLEEIAEVMSKLALREISAPCIYCNIDGFYQGIKAQLRRMIELGLSTPEKQKHIYFAESLADIENILN